jgi:hypothetical protein
MQKLRAPFLQDRLDEITQADKTEHQRLLRRVRSIKVLSVKGKKQ